MQTRAQLRLFDLNRHVLRVEKYTLKTRSGAA